MYQLTTRIFILALVVLFSSGHPTLAETPPLDQGKIVSELERYMSIGHPIKLGKIGVNDLIKEDNYVGIDDYRKYLTWADLGYITVMSVEDGFLLAMQTIVVEPTRKGERFIDESGDNGYRMLWIPIGPITISDILKVDYFTTPGRDLTFAYVAGKGRRHYTPEALSFLQSTGQSTEPVQKFKALFQYDVFDEQWEYSFQWDFAPIGEPFSTHNVKKFYGERR